jgi:hypothetical protein
MGIRDRSRIVHALAACLLAVGFLAGCAASGNGGTAAPGGSVSATPNESQSSLPPSTLGPSGGASQSGVEMTVTGELQEGVEAGCTLLRTSGVLYLLIGGDRSKMQGSTSAKVTVKGKPEPGLMTTCQQGTPFRVTEMRPA